METISEIIKALGFNPGLFFFEILVFVIGLLVLLIIRRSLKSVRNRGKTVISKNRFFEAVRSKAPFKSLKKQREKALEAYEQRFSIIRRIILITYVLIWILILISPLFGKISATVVSILAAILAAVIGIAARPFLENMIAGVVITFSKQFRTGDTVLIDDRYGTVEDITITHTVIKLWDWKRLIIPNSSMLTKEMINYTTKDSYLWAYIEFWVSYDTDIFLVEEIALDAASKSLHFARAGVPRFWIMEMDKEGIKCWVAAWSLTPTDAWYLKIDMRKRLIHEFQKHNIKTHVFNFEQRNNLSGKKSDEG